MKILVFANPNGLNHDVEQFFKSIDNGGNYEIEIVSLREQLPAYARFPDPKRKTRLEEVLAHAADATISELSRELAALKFKISKTKVLEGRFPTVVEEYVAAVKPDLLVKQTLDSDGEFGHASKGDVRLTRHVGCPVLLLHSRVERGMPVLVAVPPAFEDGSGVWLGKRIVELGCAWAKTLGSKIYFVHAWELFGENVLRTHSPPNEFAATLADAEDHARKQFDQILAAAAIPDSIEYEKLLHKGDPTRVLSGEIELQKPTLVIMGTVANDGVKGVLLGNTAEIIARRKMTSVLLVR